MIRRYTMKCMGTKEAFDEDEDQKNESAMNTKNKYENDMDSYLVKYRDKTLQSEATKEKKKPSMKNQNQHINFKESMQDHNIGSILILTGLKIPL